MEPDENPNPSERLDQAVQDRLSKLRTMPVDTSRLEKALRHQIPEPRRAWTSILDIRPLRAVAAASILFLSLMAAVLLSTSSGPAMASTSQMAQLHEDLVSGKTPAMQVDSIGAANKVLSAQSAGSPRVPNMPADHVMACCMKSVMNKKVACVLLTSEGEPVTLSLESVQPESPARSRAR